MSAKDRRKALTVTVPPALMPVLRAERRRGRSASGAAALRRVVERLLDDDTTVPDATGPGHGRPYRLQLSRATLTALEHRAATSGVTSEQIVLALLARDAISGRISVSAENTQRVNLAKTVSGG